MIPPLPKPRKVVTYDTVAGANGGALHLFGKSDAPNIVLMCAGYPDDQDCFLPFASELADEVRCGGCLVGVTCLPGYDDRNDFRYTEHRRSGYTFDEWGECLREAAKALRSQSSYGNPDGGDGDRAARAKLTVIFHDWGVVGGMWYVNKSLGEGDISRDIAPDRIVLFDVLGPPHPDTNVRRDKNAGGMMSTLSDTFYSLFYRTNLAIGFVLRLHAPAKLFEKIVNSRIGVSFLKLAFAIVKRLWPCDDMDFDLLESRQNPISVDRLLYMAYPYYHLFKLMFTGRVKEMRGCSLPKDLNISPVLYMYGMHKRVHFHVKSGLEVLKKESERKGSKCRVVAVEGAGHWLYMQKRDVCMDAVVKFMSDAIMTSQCFSNLHSNL